MMSQPPTYFPLQCTWLLPAYTDNTQSHYLTLVCEDRTETAKLSSLKLFWLPQENTTWGGGEVGPGGQLMCFLGLVYIMCLLFARPIKTRVKNDAQRSQVIWVMKKPQTMTLEHNSTYCKHIYINRDIICKVICLCALLSLWTHVSIPNIVMYKVNFFYWVSLLTTMRRGRRRGAQICNKFYFFKPMPL
jgi:hypothetical protein